jgi:tetratricopeptide (TPR) repeat protein
MKKNLLIFLILFIACKNDKIIDIERDGKVFHNDTTDLIIRDYDKTETLIIEGINLKNKNEPLKAIHKFNLAEKKYGQRLAIFLNRGFCYDMIEKRDEAIKDYSKCLEMKNDYFPALLNRGLVYKELGEIEKAMEDLNKAIEVKILEPTGYVNRASLYQDMGMPEEACADAKKAIELGFIEKYNNDMPQKIVDKVCGQ